MIPWASIYRGVVHHIFHRSEKHCLKANANLLTLYNTHVRMSMSELAIEPTVPSAWSCSSSLNGQEVPLLTSAISH
jgi:hypothetical protein